MPITTSGIKQFTQVANFQNATFTGVGSLQDNINNFITGTIDADVANYYVVTILPYFFDGTNFCGAVIYTKYEVDPAFTVPIS